MAPALAGSSPRVTAATVRQASLSDTLAGAGVASFGGNFLMATTNDEDNNSVPVARPGYTGPSEGYNNKITKDYRPVKPEALQDVLSSGRYQEQLGNRSASLGKHAADYLYVIDKDGIILVYPNGVKSLHKHADLLPRADENVYGAGHIIIKESGTVSMINDISGHFQGKGSEFFSYMKYLLDQQGIRVTMKTFLQTR